MVRWRKSRAIKCHHCLYCLHCFPRKFLKKNRPMSTYVLILGLFKGKIAQIEPKMKSFQNLPINHPRVIFTSNMCNTHQIWGMIATENGLRYGFRRPNSHSLRPNLPKVAIFECKKCYFVSGRHNLRCYY